MDDYSLLRATEPQADDIRETMRQLHDEKLMVARHRDFPSKSIHLVKCGDLIDEVNLIYDGTIRLRQAIDLTWVDQPGKVWLQDANGAQLITGLNYGAIRYGNHALDGGNPASEISTGDVRPLFETWVENVTGSFGVESGSNMEVCRITGAPYFPGGQWYYPALIETFTPGGFPTPWNDTPAIYTLTYEDESTHDMNCWVANWFSYLDDAGQDITIGSDGTAGRLCKNSGTVFDPTGLGAVAPVFLTTQYAADITFLCADGAPEQVMGG